MLKLTKTGIGLLTKQYRSVLRKCLLLNLGLLSIPTFAYADIVNEIVVYDGQGNAAAQLESDSNSGGLILYGAANEIARLVVHNGYGDLQLGGIGGGSRLTSFYFKLNNSSYATGIDFAANVTTGTTDASHLTTTGAVNQLLNNYYYTFRVDGRAEVIDYTSFFQKDFSTLQKVDLQSKNPTHLGAFAKCDEVCPRPSERFASSLSQEQMFKNNASIDAGTFSICSLQIENVNEKLSNVFDV